MGGGVGSSCPNHVVLSQLVPFCGVVSMWEDMSKLVVKRDIVTKRTG